MRRQLWGSVIIVIAAVHFLAGGGWCESAVLHQATEKALQFSRESRFKIALFADLHYGEDAWTDWGPVQDENSDRVMSTVLDKENPEGKCSHLNRTFVAAHCIYLYRSPSGSQSRRTFGHRSLAALQLFDFVVYLGDVITANNLPIPNASLYWDRAISPTRNRGIPWATVFGNHDDARFEWPSEWFSATGIPQVCCPPANFSVSGEKECSFRGTKRIELMKMEIEKNTLSYSLSGPKELWPSVSNYVLQVSSSEDPDIPVVFLYFLDSGGGSYPEVISNAQAKWFQEQSEMINPDARIPEVIFWHIPSKAYKMVAPMPIFEMHKPCVGSINEETVASQEAEWGTMDILVHRPSVKAVFVGHNHGLDWCCPYKSLWLCFSRHTGYGGYGNWPRGARILEMTENPFSLKSWIRMEDGSEHSDVILSS